MKLSSQKETSKRPGKRIVELRKMKNLSQANVCYEADIDIRMLNRLERGLLNITLNTLHSIAKILLVEMKDLFEFDLKHFP